MILIASTVCHAEPWLEGCTAMMFQTPVATSYFLVKKAFWCG
jgi:hypothetical protein